MAYQTVKSPFITKNGVSYNLLYDSATGGVQMIQQNAPPGTQPIYQDGKWTSTGTSAGFNSNEQTQIHKDTIAAVQSAYQTAGGAGKGAKLAQWASQNFSTGQPGQNTTTPAASKSGTSVNTSNGGQQNIFGAILNPDETIKNASVNGGKFGAKNEKSLFGDSSLMTYPKDLMVSKQDYFVISMYSYKPSSQAQLFSGKEGALSILKSGLQNAGNLEDHIGSCFLPMPQNVGDGNSVAWGSENMSNLAAAVTANTMGTAGSSLLSAGVGGLLGLAFGGPMTMAANFLKGKSMINLASSYKTDSMKTLLTSDVTSKLVKAQGFAVESESILARGAGIVPNSNMELLFNGPTLRTFSYSYRLSPRSAEEAKTVRRIIRFFKQGMSVKKITGKAGQASFFLGSPNVFRLEYKSGGKDIDAINKIKTCALTSFSCNYTPEGVWAAYESGQPISTVISLTFNELEPIYDQDYQEDSIFGNDDPNKISISDESVGY